MRTDVKKYYGAVLGVSGRGESVPQRDNYCEIDNNVVDEWGIPVLKFNYKWTEHEVKQAKHMQDTFEQILEATGGILLGDKPGADRNYGLTAPEKLFTKWAPPEWATTKTIR